MRSGAVQSAACLTVTLNVGVRRRKRAPLGMRSARFRCALIIATFTQGWPFRFGNNIGAEEHPWLT